MPLVIMRKAGIIISIASLSAVLLVCLFVLIVRWGAFGRLEDREELLSYKGATASLVISEEGEIIGRFFSQNRTNVVYRQIPQYLVEALIAIEDARFYRHRGIDVKSMLRVALKSVILNDPGAGGGSTISQQLAKNIYGRENFGILSVIVNKTKEILLACRLERIYSKEEILALYLNTVSFGENLYGIEAASRRYFNKRVEHLSIEESAVLIGMLKANTLYNPRLFPENSKSRRNVVLRQMEKYNYLERRETDSLSRLPLVLDYTNLESVNPAGHFLVRVKRETFEILQKIYEDTGRQWNVEEDGLIINTTLNLTLQNYAIGSFKAHLPLMQKRLRDQYGSSSAKRLLGHIAGSEMDRLGLNERSGDTVFMRVFDWDGSYNRSVSVRDSLMQALTILHAGLLALDPSTGAIRIWVGGIDHHTQPYDQILARRQMASAFKPILYAAALEQGIGPCRYFDNDSIVLDGYGNWSPVNYEHGYGGQYSLAGALSRSMNVPTFNLFLNVGFYRLNALWKDMGFRFMLDNTPALALGTAEANIIETATAYSVFANGGYKVTPYSIESIIAPGGQVIYQKDTDIRKIRILSERSAMLMGAMLEKAIDQGTAISMRNNYGVALPLAGKTGTSQNFADAWFAAFNPSIVIVSRAGASTPLIHFNSGANGSGSSLALPLVALTLQAVQGDRVMNDRFAAPFTELPPNLERSLDCPDYREKTIFERFADFFKRDVNTFVEKEAEEEPEKRSFLRRLFRR
jgi:penicillin-binding protein 1A